MFQEVKKTMKIILVAGGSGGHIYPCLEMAKYFQEKGHQVLLCGKTNSMEEKIYKQNSFEFKGINISKSKTISSISNVFKVKRIYKTFKPDAVLLFGNYISLSFAIGAIMTNIPIFIHEQNVIYGRANKLMGIFARRIYLSLPITQDIYKKKSLLVGNPQSDKQIKWIKFKNKYNVVIAMGSLGSSSMNKIIKEFIKLCDNDIDLHIVTGKKHYDDFKENITMNENIHLYPYVENLAEYIKSADLIISRAGATTISEILVNAGASILIPSPYVKDNHQYLNVKYLLDNKACVFLSEKNIDSNILCNEVYRLLNNYSEIIKLKMSARQLAIVDARTNIYKDILKNYER